MFHTLFNKNSKTHIQLDVYEPRENNVNFVEY